MKKLLSSAAVIGLALAATPAYAGDGLTVELGGFFKGYGMYTSQDDEGVAAPASSDSRNFDIIRNTEVHVGGETTLDNGLTVGVHLEMDADTEEDFGVQESYAYFSGGWGRANFGAEDGAAYLLQVEAPSADANLDGLRQYVNPINFATMERGGSLAALNVGAGDEIDYDQDVTGYADKLTYLSPIYNGFQAGLSYTPDIADAATEDAINLDDVDDTQGSAWELAVRYEGMFNNIGVILGAGYTNVDLEDQIARAGGDAFTEDQEVWNAGIDLDIGPFGVGVAYMEDDFGDDPTGATTEMEEEETWVVGVDYTTGPFKLGASYLNKDALTNLAGVTDVEGGIEVDRWTAGVIYTYGPGMTFRGSVSRAGFDDVPAITVGGVETSPDATSVLIGTQIDF